MMLVEVIGDLLRDGPRTAEALFVQLSRDQPALVARGLPWLELELRRLPGVEELPGGQFGLRAEQQAFEFAIPEDLTRSITATAPISTYVVFDLEANADRSSVTEHEIIEIGACRVTDGVVKERFQSLVQPTRSLTPEVRQLTGLEEESLRGAPALDEVLPRFLDFVADSAVVAHNGLAYDFPLLAAACAAAGLEPPTGLRLDTLELAHVVFPRAGEGLLPNSDGTRPPTGRGLDALAHHFGIPMSDQRHRALDDVELTLSILRRMLDLLNGDEPRCRLQRWLLKASGHDWGRLLQDGVQEALNAVVPAPREPRGFIATGRFDPQAAVAPLEEGGVLIDAARTHRPEQSRMARVVADALAEQEVRLVEAPTGTGKTLAYLVPAIAFARASGQPVIVATHSKVLQNQVLSTLAELDGPFGGVETVLLKGKENYLSLSELQSVIDVPPQSPDDALALAVIVGWAATTPTGDWDDLRTWALDARSDVIPRWRWRLSVESTPGVARTELDGKCFYRRALEGLCDAHVAVLNHALLVSRDDWIEASKYLVIDEAHNLEEAATAALSEDVTDRQIGRLLDAIHDPGRRWGTLGRYCDATGRGVSDKEVKAVREALDECRAAHAAVARVVVDYVRDRLAVRSDEVAAFGASYRITPSLDSRNPGFEQLRRLVGRLRGALFGLSSALSALPVPEQLRRRYRRDRLEHEIARMSRRAREAAELLGVIPVADDESWIPLIDLTVDGGAWTWGFRRVPLRVSRHLRQIWDALRSVVMTSATLRVAGSFDHLASRLGLATWQSTALPTPFDRLAEHELIVLPDHLPMPRGGLLDEFTAAEADELARLFLVSGGRALALFTARSRMTYARDHVRPALDQFQIPVLCQGEGPAPALVDRMRSEKTTSLLATRSFWEGVDIPGENLSLLVIEKLPFDSPADPVVAARMDDIELHGGDPFADYLVPQAVLRFVQGVGRLIRTKDDKGVVVVLDKRLRRPLVYRDQFLQSLPGTPSIARPSGPDDAYRRIAEHLGTTFDDELLARLAALPTHDPLAGLGDLELSDADAADPSIVRDRLERARELLGLREWRPGQLEVMERFIAGRDVLAVLPTGSGKSLTYQLPALLRPGLTLVISPLVALMRDQVRTLQDRGISQVQAITSGQAQSEQEEILRGARQGRYKLLYVSPERIWSKRFRDALKTAGIARVAIDEAHCISQWGHTFRPEYASIASAVKQLADTPTRPPVLAVTATATQQVQDEVVELLDLQLDAPAIVRSPDRPELRYYVELCADRSDRDVRVVRVVESFRDMPVIVYVPRREDATRVASLLRAANHSARAYHGGMEAGRRLHVEQAFVDGEINVVVATKAFGLGIDKPDIAAIVHLEMPASIEEYIQETGRAARGAVQGVGPATAACVLLRMPRDCGIHASFVKDAAPDLEVVKRVWGHLARAGELLIPLERLAQDVGIDEKDKEAVSLAIHYLVAAGSVERREDLTWTGRVWVPSDAEEALAAIEPLPEELTGASELLAKIRWLGSEDYSAPGWASAVGLEPVETERLLLELMRRDIVGFTSFSVALHLRRSGIGDPDWDEIERRCGQRRSLVKQLSAKAKAFARNDSGCRRALLLRYLGQEAADRCDGCDVCRPDLDRPWDSVAIDAQDLVEALPVNHVVLALLADVEGADYSETTLKWALVGKEGRFEKPQLKSHSAYGRLAPLGLDGVSAAIDRLVDGGQVQRVEVESDGRTWTTLKLTELGRDEVR